MPKFEMEKVPPWYSCGLSLLSRAFVASDFTSDDIVASPLPPTLVMIGVMRPAGVETAIEISALLYLQMRKSAQLRSHSTDSSSLSYEVTHPGRVDFWHILKRNRGSLDDKVVDGELDTSFNTVF